jgi:hypothetical protein
MSGIIKGCFGKHMTTETKLLVHNITSKMALCCGNENLTINKGDGQKLEAVQVRFMRQFLGLERLYCQRRNVVTSGSECGVSECVVLGRDAGCLVMPEPILHYRYQSEDVQIGLRVL